MNGTSEQTSAEDVVKPYEMLIDNFDASQKTSWALWAGRLPERVALVKNGLRTATRKVDFWQNITYVGVIFSAAIPIILTIIIETQKWTNLASLLDAVFPTIVGIVQTKLKSWSEKRHAYASVISTYGRLLADILVDIRRNEYASHENLHNAKWEELDKILMSASIL